ncbi:sodium-independent anion transporter [Solemya velesiana gill symbiont]|uniref:Sodium-independent anion transporter n=1 Tax=Solemya velesiana gill symbiont TaxID=1918948 RepID=A0A1T2KS09_9GAMM|nr:sodium-independent anion transporter [Solemya velesiana gill symbiont]
MGELRDKSVLKADIIAGITVALVLVPQSMAYAQLAGLPAYYGLYASFLPPMVAALFGSSRQLATGPVAMVSLMTATALAPIASQSGDGFLIYALILSLMVGVFQVALGLLRLGVLVDLLSHPVVVGFTNAGAIIIATSQLNKVLGVDKGAGDAHYESVYNTVLTALESTHMPTLYMSILALGIMIILKKYMPKVPNVLVAVVVTTVLAWYTGFSESGGKVVGNIPDGLPGLTIPTEFDMDIVMSLISYAIIISLVGFMEAIAIAKAMAVKTKQRLDANQELVGQGLSNLASGFFSGYPVSGSFSRSAVNINAGAVTGFSSVVTGIVVALTLLLLTPLLYHLPLATLASVIILAVANLVKFKPIVHAWKAEPHDGITAVITFLLTLYIAPHIEYGILVGVVLSIILFVIRFMRPRVAELSRYEDGTMRDIAVFPELEVSDKIALIRFDGSLFFANASYFEFKVLEVMANRPDLKYIILDAEGINQIDSSGEEVLSQVADRLTQNGVTLVVARMKRQFMQALRRTGLHEKMGEGNFFSRITYALDFVWDSLGDEYDRTTCPLRRLST